MTATSLQAGGSFFPFKVLALRNDPTYQEARKLLINNDIQYSILGTLKFEMSNLSKRERKLLVNGNIQNKMLPQT